VRPKESLHTYQQDAITYLYEHDHALALMPVGAGKTVVTMTALQELMADGHVTRPLVFAPLRVASLVWPYEGDEWEHLKGTPIVAWGGEPSSWPDSIWKQSRVLWGQRTHAEQRLPKIVDVRKRRELEAKLKDITAEEKRINKQARNTEPSKAIHVTSYENMLWLCELYAPGESPFDAWVFDELGKLKNPKSPRYKAVKKHTAKVSTVFGLNATPAPEGFFDLFAQVQVVDGPRLWGKSVYDWRQKYFAPVDYMGFQWRLQLGAQDLLMRDLNTIAFKVDETQLSYQRSMQHNQIVVELPPKARAAYDEMEKKMAVAIEGQDDIVAMSAAAASMKLRQITSGFIYDEEGRTTILHEEKQHALADLVDDMGREPLLVAYEFAEDLEAIRRVWKGVKYLGQGVSSATAKETVDAWNRRQLPVLALHKASAGHGINLQAGGSHVCWYTLPWDLEGWVQLNGRIDRQGQTRACYGHSIVARNSMDDRVWAALTDKDAEQNKIIAAIRNI
jgi:hypothetical protein